MSSPNMFFCKRCVISNLRPTSTLEGHHSKGEKKPTTNFVDGICDACIWAEKKNSAIDWDKREKELKKTCDRFRKNNGDYDVIVPASGGKDSIYVAHILKDKYGMNPLTVTWAPNLPTEIGKQNHYNMVRSGFTNLMISPDGEVHRKLTTFAFKNLGHPFQPFIFGQRSVGPKVAILYDVKLVFYGENVAEYGNNIEDNYFPTMKPELFTCYDTDDENTLLGGISVKDLKEQHGFKRADFIDYKSPNLNEVLEKGIEVHYMSYYRKWVPQENYYYAIKNSLFQPSPTRSQGSYSKYSGVDDKLEWLHYYMMYIKFGMGRATADAAQEIRSDKISRDEAINLVRLYDGEFPEIFLQDFLDYFSMKQEDFFSIIDGFRQKHLWDYIGEKWVLKHQI